MQQDSLFIATCRFFPTCVNARLPQISGLLICLVLALNSLGQDAGKPNEAVSATVGEAAKPTVEEADVLAFVRQLESKQSAIRETAEEKLRSLGPKALDFLPSIDERMGAELKVRLQRVRDYLDKARVEETTKASRLTLQGTMLLTDALDAIKDQTENEIIDYRGRIDGVDEDFEIDLSIKDEPFWAAFDKFADAAAVTIYPYVGESRKLAIVKRADGAIPRYGHAYYQGLFRVEATSIVCRTNLRDPQGARMQIGFEVLWEPKVLPVLLRQDLGDVQVTTDNGESLGVSQTGVSQIPINSGVASLDLQVPVSLPSRDAKQLASVKGKFIALVPGGDVSFEFDDLVDFKDSAQTRGGLTVSIDDVRLNNGLPQISVRVRFGEAGEAMQSHLGWVENNVVELRDPQGKPIEPGAYERYIERDNEVGFRYVFDAEGAELKDWKFVYRSAAGIASIPIEYELKDIRLP